jgi:hypothetical protein
MNTPRRHDSGRDVQLIGALFGIVGVVDAVIITLYLQYDLKVFGTTLTNTSGLLVKFHSPTVHYLLGHGFLLLQPWAWGLAVAYAGFGIVSEIMNQVVWEMSWIRSGFILMTMFFVVYVIHRRGVFTAAELNQKGKTGSGNSLIPGLPRKE